MIPLVCLTRLSGSRQSSPLLIADALCLILRAAEVAVRVFYDGLAAFEHAQQETPDIVLSDIAMP